MTKKDYKLIVEVLRGQKEMLNNPNTSVVKHEFSIEAVRAWNAWDDCILEIAKSLADKLKENNENFDRKKFLEAIFNTN